MTGCKLGEVVDSGVLGEVKTLKCYSDYMGICIFSRWFFSGFREIFNNRHDFVITTITPAIDIRDTMKKRIEFTLISQSSLKL